MHEYGDFDNPPISIKLRIMNFVVIVLSILYFFGGMMLVEHLMSPLVKATLGDLIMFVSMTCLLISMLFLNLVYKLLTGQNPL